MKAWIDEDGYLHIQGEESIEVYALKVWCDQSPQVGELPDNLIVHLILPEVRREVDAQFKKTKCCGSCKWCDDHEDPICINRNSDSFGHSKFIRECCGKWEVRE